MNIKSPSAWLRFRTACDARLLLLLLLTLPAAVQAQFSYTTINGTITITGYTGPDGAVIIPDTIDGLPVTTIGDDAFANRGSMTSVTIPNSVTSIGHYAFKYCSSLTSVTIPNSVTNIGNAAFLVCYSLTGVTIPNGVPSIGDLAFIYCTSLTNVTLPNGLTSIGIGAFHLCRSLTSVTIPDSVTSIGRLAFGYCNRLTEVYFHGNAPSVGLDTFAGTYNATVYYLPGTTGWGTTFGGRPTALWLPRLQTSDASFGVRTNQFGFNIAWASDRVVVVEACTNLTNPAWVPVGTNTLTGGSSYFSDQQWTNHPVRFYRLRSP